VGSLLKERIQRFLVDLDVPRGLSGLGYNNSHIPALVKGALPQHRVLVLAPGYEGGDEGAEQLAGILEKSMSY